MRTLLLAVVMSFTSVLVGCGPVYIPSAVSLPMQTRKGDIHLNAQGGSQGAQGNMAYAITDSVNLRATVQNSQSVGADADDFYRMGSVGAGFYTALSNTQTGNGLRLGGSAELGGGIAEGNFEQNANDKHLEGFFLRSAVQTEFGYELKHFAFGVAGRIVYLNFQHADASDVQDATNRIYGEPVIVIRVGGPRVKAEGQGGLVFPIVEQGDVGDVLPFIISFGVTADF